MCCASRVGTNASVTATTTSHRHNPTNPTASLTLALTKGPLAPTELERPPVALTWEVEPLRVAELIAHKAQPRLAANRHGDGADHHVQRQAALRWWWEQER